MYKDDLSFSTMDVNKFYCGSMVCITSEGYYTPCSVIRTTEFGNYKSLRLKDILTKNPGDILMMKLRNPENLPEPCSDCEQNEVCFGCRSSAFYYSGDMFGCDPKCTKCQPKLST
ncbi:MAG: SPASM domain-containing protein [Candidatus Hodarchaeota archaeon]